MQIHAILSEVFGHSSFREGQEALIRALCSGRDVMGIMPTGGGKSLCYQIPALSREGTALVISPLISLMKDQVAALKAAGVPAGYLNSSLSAPQQELAMQRALAGAYRLLYVAPERLSQPGFRAFAARLKPSLIAVDEAHCVSQWGQDFRPDYLRITDFTDSLPERPPVGAFTATATPRVQADMVRLLGLRNPLVTVTGYDRLNLFFEVIPVRRQRNLVLLEVLSHLPGESGIVYCAIRREVEQVCDLLQEKGVAAVRYHAGLPDAERRQNQEDFQYDRARVMVATNAFGMGIDKSNVHFVIHHSMPKSPEAYYQEAGRAGRDGEPSFCVLLCGKGDITAARRLIQGNPPNPELTVEQAAEVRRVDLSRLKAMADLCQGSGCFRAGLLRYFGQQAPGRCSGCSRCCPSHFPAARELAVRLMEGRKKTEVVLPNLRDFTVVPADPIPADGEPSLFEQLRACRTTLARAMGQPPYIVCSDRTLRDMAEKRPRTPAEMLEVYGMGRRKTASFGEAFLAVLNGQPPEDAAPVTAPGNPAPAREIPAPPSDAAALADRLAAALSPEAEATLRQGWLEGAGIRDLAGRLGRSPEETALLLVRLALLD